MTLLLVCFLAGVLTVLAPCVLPLLPIIIGGSVSDATSKWKPFVITGSLIVSIIIFTLLLKATTAFITIPQSVWTTISGGVLVVFGLITLFPGMWDSITKNISLGKKSGNKLLATGVKKKSFTGDILIGAALGPVFSSCSPAYLLVLGTVLPESFAKGMVYLLAYVLGLGLILLLIGFLGQKFVTKLSFASNPKGWFKRGLGVLFLLVGLAVLLGADKQFETFLLEKGVYSGVGSFEQSLIEKAQ